MSKNDVRILLVFFFFSINLFSQKKKIKDNFKYKATYQITAQLDSLDNEFIVKEENHLLIGDKISSFSSKAMLVDRIIKSRNNIASTPRNTLTEFPYIIIKDKEKDVLYYLHKVGENNLMYREQLDQFNWNIEEDYKLIDKYNCQKATVNWADRKFIAWFTLDLALTEGPYKFNGLPGIIIHLEDSKGHYKYEMVSFTKLSEPLDFNLNLKDYVEVSKSKLKKELTAYSLDSFGYINNPDITISPKVLNTYKKEFKRRFEQRNNPIELND